MKIRNVLIATILVTSAMPAFAQEKPAMKKAEIIDLNKLISCDVDAAPAPAEVKKPVEAKKPSKPRKPQPRVSVSCGGNCAAVEGGAPGVLTFDRTAGDNKDLSKDLWIDLRLSGSANNGADHNAIPNKVLIPAGVPTTTLVVTPTDDTVYKDTRTVGVEVVSGKGYEPGSPSTATVTIADNDPKPGPPPAPVIVPIPGPVGPPGAPGKDAPVPPAAPIEPPPVTSGPPDPGWNNLHLAGGISGLGVGELPLPSPKSGMILRGPAHFSLVLDGVVGYIDEKRVVDLVLRASPFGVGWAQDQRLEWHAQQGLTLGAGLAHQWRLSNAFAIGIAGGGLYQATNLNFQTGKSTVSSVGAMVGPRMTWSVMPLGPSAKIDLVLDPFLGVDYQYSKPIGAKAFNTWLTPMFGLSFGIMIGTRGPDVPEAASDSLLGTTATERMQR